MMCMQEKLEENGQFAGILRFFPQEQLQEAVSIWMIPAVPGLNPGGK